MAAKDPKEFKWKPEMTTKSYKSAQKRYSAKMSDKEKDKVKADVIAAGGRYKELSDEEVAANEASWAAGEASKGASKPPTSKELGTVLKETGKKPKAKSGKGMDTAQVPKVDAKPKAEPKPKADKKQFGKVDVTPVVAPATPTEAPATSQVPRSDSSGNTVDLSRYNKQPEKKGGLRDKYPALADVEDKMSPEEKAQNKSDMNVIGDKWEAELNEPIAEVTPMETASTDSAAPAESKKSGGPYVLNTDKTGKAEPVTGTKSQAKGTAAMNRIRRDRDSGLRGFDPATAPEGRGTPGPQFYDWSDEDAGITKSSPTASAPASAPAKGGMGARLRGFFGGHDSAKGSPLPPPSAGPSSSTPSAGPTPSTPTSSPMAPSFSRSQHFQGGHTVNQQGMGGQNFNAFNDNAGGTSPASSGSGSINNNYATIQANTGDGNTYGNVKGATINSGPTVASTAGRATSANKNANVLSTGGPATQTNAKAQNAKSSGRPTTSKSKNPRTEKP